MTWISLIGITLAVFALVATLAIRTGLREETVRTILGANAHVEIYYRTAENAAGGQDRKITDYDALAERLRAVDGVIDAIPVVTGRVIGNLRDSNAPVELYGVRLEDLKRFETVASPEVASGDIERLSEGIALGGRLAGTLGARVGDTVRIISPNGVRTAFGTSPRVSAYEVVYIFQTGHALVDATRGYLALDVAQPFLNREGAADQIDVMVQSPQDVAGYTAPILTAAGDRAYLWTWQDRSGGMIRALQLQDNAIYVLLCILVLIATMNIVSGLIMLVKNKGRDIGILRTIGLSRSAVLRVFFLVGASIGTLGTIFGTVLGVVFALNIEHVYGLMDVLTGRGKTELEAQGFFFPPAVLRLEDVAMAAGFSLLLSWIITYFPARRAAALSPVEALRYE